MPVSLWLYHRRNKHTWISTIILHTKLSMVYPIEHFRPKHALVPWNRREQLLFYRELYPEAPLGPPVPTQPRLLGRVVAPPGSRPWPRAWGPGVAPSGIRPWPRTRGNSSRRPPWLRSRGNASRLAPDLRRGVAPLGHSGDDAAWHSRPLFLTSDVG